MIRLLAGDCRDVLATLPEESVQCVVTSPPYYGLRDYGTALWDGGDAGCEHRSPRTGGSAQAAEQRQRGLDRGYAPASNFANYGERWTGDPYRDTCGKCGAVRVDRQIGLEATPDEYLATMVGVFREVRRVLRRDGTCWVNIGDSFSGGNNVGWRPGNPTKNGGVSNRDGVGNVPGLAAKQLLLMPARLALALQADGWWIRSDIIWAKPNPMPESCRDRPTSAHEHVFLLTRSARYFYDADAVRSPLADKTFTTFGTKHRSQGNDAGGNVKSDNWGSSLDERKPKLNGAGEIAGAACRNVWTIATHAYPDAHFATFPPELAERCIKAGTSERGCCAACGKPWVRVTEREQRLHHTTTADGKTMDGPYAKQAFIRHGVFSDVTTTGWAPGCQCQANYDCSGLGCGHQPCICIGLKPCTVLDPFAGAGTTLLVADRLQRDAIGIDLNTSYTTMAMARCRNDAPLLTEISQDTPAPDLQPTLL